jgi:hypothetical protein
MTTEKLGFIGLGQGPGPRIVVWRFAVSECVGERSLERDGATGETPMQR